MPYKEFNRKEVMLESECRIEGRKYDSLKCSYWNEFMTNKTDSF